MKPLLYLFGWFAILLVFPLLMHSKIGDAMYDLIKGLVPIGILFALVSML